MKTKRRMSVIICFVLLTLLVGCGNARAQVVTLNFDSVTALQFNATGYLATFGITVTNVVGVDVDIVNQGDFGAVISAPSSPNVLLQQTVGGAGGTTSYTLNFSTPLQSIDFTRAAISGAALAQWSATAFSGSTMVGSVQEGPFIPDLSGEGGATSFGSALFSITGPEITSLTISAYSFRDTLDRNLLGQITSPPLDDMVLHLEAVPEPATWAASGIASILLTIRLFRHRRSKV
jgi:hypothetical protein